MTTNRDAFDDIAASWYNVRHWPLLHAELAEVATRWNSGRLINLGCGHGPDFLPMRDKFDLVGVDFSRQMLLQGRKYAKRRHISADTIQGDLIALPFGDCSFDYAIAVASYHHVEGKAARQQAFADLLRVLRPGGEVFLSVWNHLQPRFWFGSKDQQIPFRVGERTLNRYYHMYDYWELRRVMKKAGFTIEWMGGEKRFDGPLPWFSRNICVLARKPSSH